MITILEKAKEDILNKLNEEKTIRLNKHKLELDNIVNNIITCLSSKEYDYSREEDKIYCKVLFKGYHIMMPDIEVIEFICKKLQIDEKDIKVSYYRNGNTPEYIGVTIKLN